MPELIAGLTIDFLPLAEDAPGQRIAREAAEPFLLQLDKEEPATPIQLFPAAVNFWSYQSVISDMLMNHTLMVTGLGRQRVRLYCSASMAMGARVYSADGAITPLGRRFGTMVQTLTWSGQLERPLRFPYDRPEVTILDQTAFYNDAGQEATPPAYDPARGAFRQDEAVTGAMVVEYRPGYSLFEIAYDSGMERGPPELYGAMRTAWLAGNINDATIPPVRIFAIGSCHATQVEFPRRFWPDRAPLLRWQDPYNKKQPPKNNPNKTQWNEVARESITERIFDPEDHATYLDVKRSVAITFQDEDGQEMALRLQSD